MSNHKGGGMASKERLYELWMLYYTKVSASAEEDLSLTPVVAAAGLSTAASHTLIHSHRHSQRHSQVSKCECATTSRLTGCILNQNPGGDRRFM